MIQYRMLLDSFVSVRYLFLHEDHSEAFLKGEKVSINGSTKYLRPKDMYDELSPGFYHKYYGPHLSAFSHGKFGSRLFRTTQRSETGADITHVPSFNLEWAGYVVNRFKALLLGYLKFYAEKYRINMTKWDDTFEKEYNAVCKWFQDNIATDKIEFPKMKIWYEHMEKIILLENV